tara:strand:- start:17090 stop:17680 length:591 start_codon:yes stop_codon:yes gene_type:complete
MSDQNDQDQVEVEVEVDETEIAINEAFTIATDNGDDEDSVKMAMIQAGATFKNVTRLFNALMIDAGLAISKEDKDQTTSDTLEGRVFESEEDFNSAVSDLMSAITGSTERSAAALVRAYAKKNELATYTKPKGTGGNRSGFATKFYDWLAETARTADEVKAYIAGDGDHEDTSDNVKKHASHYVAIGAMAEKIWSA